MKPSPVSYGDLLSFFATEEGSHEQTSRNSRKELGIEWCTNCGLFFAVPPLRNFGYPCTPVNSVQFARTGADGVHFSFVGDKGGWSERSPIVMTSPACPGSFNVIVGENLEEFLRLGIRTGYFALAELAVGSTEDFAENHFVIEDLLPGSMGDWLDPEEMACLEHLAQKFQLTPWENVADRLNELQQKYLPMLRTENGCESR